MGQGTRPHRNRNEGEMQMTNDHTPTPWCLRADGFVLEPEGLSSIQNYGIPLRSMFVEDAFDETHERHEEAKANAAFIVRAVNAHDALVGALEKMKEFYVQLIDKKIKVPSDIWVKSGVAIMLTDNALKLAKEPAP